MYHYNSMRNEQASHGKMLEYLTMEDNNIISSYRQQNKNKTYATPDALKFELINKSKKCNDIKA